MTLIPIIYLFPNVECQIIIVSPSHNQSIFCQFAHSLKHVQPAAASFNSAVHQLSCAAMTPFYADGPATPQLQNQP